MLILLIVQCSALLLGNSSSLEINLISLDSVYFTMQVICQNTWCGVGFQSTYENADLFIVTSSLGAPIVIDALSKPSYKFETPLVDVQQDYRIINSSLVQGGVSVLFMRRIQTDDPTDFVIPQYTLVPMFYLIGNSSNYTNYQEYGSFNFTFSNTTGCHYTCSSCFGPFAQQCSGCNSGYLINSTCLQQNNLTSLAYSVSVILTDFQIQWSYDTQFIYLLFTVSQCSWFGIGFNNTQMNTTDMLLFEVLAVNTSSGFLNVKVHDMQGIYGRIPDEDTMQGGQQDWIILGQSLNNNLMQIKVKRTIKNIDIFDYDFTNQTDINALYAFSNGTSMSYHDANRGVFTLPLSNSAIINVDFWTNLLFRGHAILLFIFWGALSDVGIFFARQLKSYPKHAKIHGMIFMFQAFFTYFFVFAMIAHEQPRIQGLGYQSILDIVHFIFGVSVLVMVTIQLIMGAMVKNNLESMHGTQRIFRVKRLHYFFGYTIYILTKVQVAIGMQIYESDLLSWFYAYYLLLLLVKVSVELLYQFEISIIPINRIKYQYVEIDQGSLYNSIVEKLNQGTAFSEMVEDYPKITYVLLREAIYDISDFNHPGGQFIFNSIKGREIGRYFYGGYPIQNLQLKQHTHSMFAINYIETRYLGDFKNEQCPVLYIPEIHKKVPDQNVWRLIDQKKLTPTTGVFTFQSLYYKVRENLQGVQWMGRYFYIKPFGAGQFQERPYSIVLCLSESSIHYRKQIIEYFKANLIKPSKLEITSLNLGDTLSFAIKKQWNSRNISKFVHTTTHKRYELTGPYGFGLELQPDSTGVHYIFCQGTGVLPFLDLLDFLLKKSIKQILLEKCGQESANAIECDDSLNNFSLILFGAFRSPDQFPGLPIAQDLLYLSHSHQTQIFDMHIRYAKKYNQPYEVNERFTRDFMKTSMKFQPNKVYIVGGPKFEEDIMKNLLSIGIDKRIIVQI